jgi:hypothetical protein
MLSFTLKAEAEESKLPQDEMEHNYISQLEEGKKYHWRQLDFIVGSHRFRKALKSSQPGMGNEWIGVSVVDFNDPDGFHIKTSG